MKRFHLVAALAGIGTAFTIVAPAFAQTVSASASASAGVSGLDSLLSVLTGLLGGTGL